MAAETPGVASRKVVVDAGAAIMLQRLERFGGELFTTSGVLAEVKDAKAQALLRTLPQELRTREPLPQDITFVKQFAKGTGDLGFLSHSDIELIALTVALQRESGGEIRQRPSAPVVSSGQVSFDWAPPAVERTARFKAVTKRTPEPPQAEGGDGWTAVVGRRRPAEGPGHHQEQPGSVEADSPAAPAPSKPESTVAEVEAVPDEETAKAESGKACAPHELTTAMALTRLRARAVEPARVVAEGPLGEPAPEPGPTGLATEAPPPEAPGSSELEEVAGEPEPDAAPATNEDAEAEQGATEGQEPAEGEVEEEDGDDGSEDGSSAGEWVTPENIHRLGQSVAPAVAEAGVTCATADYSVQNVLLQMGISPLTFDGYAVQSVRVWGLLCRACAFFTRDTQKIFCPKCGHDTVIRVPIVVDQEGKVTIMNAGRKLRTKGTIYSIPNMPTGRAWKPIFAEDELKLGSRDREQRHLERVCEKERQARDPFNDFSSRSWWQRGTTSTGKSLSSSAPRVQAGYGRRNPNANNFKFKTGKRK